MGFILPVPSRYRIDVEAGAGVNVLIAYVVIVIDSVRGDVM